jgi:hypothetical protein
MAQPDLVILERAQFLDVRMRETPAVPIVFCVREVCSHQREQSGIRT